MSNKKQPVLKELGLITHITSTQKYIVPSTKTPKIGSLIVNRKNKAIGKINDIIGTTKKPYISIKTNKKFNKAKPGETVYLKNRKNKKRRNKRRLAY